MFNVANIMFVVASVIKNNACEVQFKNNQCFMQFKNGVWRPIV